MIKLDQQNHFILMELCHKKVMLNQTKLVGYMHTIFAKKDKFQNSFWVEHQQMIVNKENSEIAGLCQHFL
jgi:hypothetical protein